MQENEKKNGVSLLWEAVGQSWVAWGLLWSYVTLNLAQEHPSEIGLGALALGTILLAMNSLARTELWWTSRGPEWFRHHPLAKRLHYIHNEGELAGITVALVVLGFQLYRGHHPHFAFGEAFTLLGIMSAANLAVDRMMPIMARVEAVAGKWGAIVVGSLISSFTGEPAAAVFLSEYFKYRTPEKDRARVATALGATIGSGGGLMPFSAPPILIIWSILGEQFGWGLQELLLYVGGACVLHVSVVAWRVRTILGVMRGHPPAGSFWSFWPLGLLSAVVVLNMSYSYHHQTALTWGVDALVGVWAVVAALRKPRQSHESEGHEQHGRHWQPLTLGLLLMGLEIVGAEAEPLLLWGASFIPSTFPVLGIALILWYLSAFTSHFADNALASRIYITVAVALSAVVGYPDLLAMSVILGALFGGFLLIPANLPNFAIAAEFGVKPKEWAGSAWKWYPSGLVHVAWIAAWYYFF